MILVLLLAGVEKLVNFAIKSDDITKLGLMPLSGKTLRLNMGMPQLNLDVLFQDEHIRFEPVKNEPIFETNFNANDAGDERMQAQAEHDQFGHSRPDCTLTVANPAELLSLMRNPEGNLPIEGDYKVLMQVRQLVAGFSPDFAAQLEPFIGIALASQLSLLITHLKGNIGQTAKNAFNDVTDWANDVAGNTPPDPMMQAEVNDLHQQLLQLRADVEREQAKLNAIKAEQARVNG